MRRDEKVSSKQTVPERAEPTGLVTVSNGREGGHVTEMQRRRLLLGFAEVLTEHGLEDASVGRVCKRAGVSRRTFYDLFDDREGCFLATFDEAVERMSQSILPAYEQGVGWRGRIRAGLTALLELLDREPALAHVCLAETLKGGPAILERRRRLLDALSAAVDEGRSESKSNSAPPQVTAQATVGGVASVLHARVLERKPSALTDLLNPLMSMIVLPYLGTAAAHRELERPLPQPLSDEQCAELAPDPFKDLPIRITFRTARVLITIAARPGASNREVGDDSGVPDQGQISKLLRRLEGFGLIENNGQGHTKGEPNAWRLTERGRAIQHALEVPAA